MVVATGDFSERKRNPAKGSEGKDSKRNNSDVPEGWNTWVYDTGSIPIHARGVGFAVGPFVEKISIDNEVIFL